MMLNGLKHESQLNDAKWSDFPTKVVVQLNDAHPTKYMKFDDWFGIRGKVELKWEGVLRDMVESEKRGVKRSNDDDDDDDNDGDDDPLGKLVSSIKVLADGFVKMEKMKMDMVREIETMRMEAEMKRNEMFLESQRQMVAAFVKWFV
ncbi:hypothetical protein Tco_0906629 [Tanacetum coccineum]|uniref:Uncharacterized protein n=1 Tax=Tanacetum coccineum TaxID=301880 RepID=A0ABQ5CN67_9ASTR